MISVFNCKLCGNSELSTALLVERTFFRGKFSPRVTPERWLQAFVFARDISSEANGADLLRGIIISSPHNDVRYQARLT